MKERKVGRNYTPLTKESKRKIKISSCQKKMGGGALEVLMSAGDANRLSAMRQSDKKSIAF